MRGYAAISNIDGTALSKGRGWSRRAGPGEGLVGRFVNAGKKPRLRKALTAVTRLLT
jgi:hypothetical protein